jgi:hypothetical protein
MSAINHTSGAPSGRGLIRCGVTYSPAGRAGAQPSVSPDSQPLPSPPRCIAADARLEDFVQQTIDRWLAIDPANAVYQGAHQYDGKLPDWSEAGLKARGDFLRSVIAGARRYSRLTGADAFERDYLVQVAEGQLFWLEDSRQPATLNPQFLRSAAGARPERLYDARICRQADADEAMIAFFEQVPPAARNIRRKTCADAAALELHQVRASPGSAALPNTTAAMLAPASPTCRTRCCRRAFRDASEAATQAMAGLADWLKATTAGSRGQLAPSRGALLADAEDHRAVDVPLDRLEAVGRADLRRNQAALREACAAYAPAKRSRNASRNSTPTSRPKARWRRRPGRFPTHRLRPFARSRDDPWQPSSAWCARRHPTTGRTAHIIDPPGPY